MTVDADITPVPVDGFVADGFEPVLAELQAHAADLGEQGGAFAACVGGELVVDLRAGYAAPGRPWAADTLAVLFSASKGLGTACVMLLVDRGVLDLDREVAAYWPEFAQNGKERITVRQLLSHTTGVVTLPDHESLISREWDGTGFDDVQEIGRRLAAVAPSWEPGTAHGYQALTYGWLLDQVIRRVDGRSIGVFFAQEIARPWGLDLRIGTPDDEQARVARLAPFQEPPDIPELAPVIEIWNAWKDPARYEGQAFLASGDGQNVFTALHRLMGSPAMLRAELASGNATGTAAALARFYAGMAGGGVLDGVRLFSPEVVQSFRASTAHGVDKVLGLEWNWALGFHCQVPMGTLTGLPSPMGPGSQTFGHGGAGGQMGAADPQAGVAIGFVRSKPTNLSLLSGHLTARLYDCLGRLG